jgi:beta-galactosidase
MKEKELNDLSGTAGWTRRDALKAVAMLATAPLASSYLAAASSVAQTGGAAPVTAAKPGVVAAGRRDQPFDDGWRFLRDDAPGAEAPDFKDASWRTLDLPHDFSVEELPPRPADANGEDFIWGASVLPVRVGPFDTDLSAGGRDTGWFVGGVGWYRKRFSASDLSADDRVEIVFDGVYMNSDVWLNGNLLGNHPYGYTTFAYDLTPHLRRDGENVLAVRVRNEGRTSRWYSGSGIYRHVWLNTTSSVCVPLWGISVTTPEVSKDNASVKVAVRIENHASSARDVKARIRLVDAKNATAGTRDLQQFVAAGASADVDATFAVATPQLWSVNSPQLYRAEVELLVGDKAVDKANTTFGIRKIEMDAELGLRINGESLKLKGGCMHHDNGLLGSAAIDRAEERRVELMKAHGFNAIRTSHNPPSPAFLDTCDRLGIVVIDEAFDCWETGKNDQDYHLYFAAWWKRDIDAMVLRDRNHPSVILWSIGNEIPERAQPHGVEMGKQIAAYVKTLDTSRPITAAVNPLRGGDAKLDIDVAFEPLDLNGNNYRLANYEADHAHHQKWVITGTESFPSQSYANWRLVEKNSYVIGDFVWTAMDYLGESSIGNAQLNAPPRRSWSVDPALPSNTPAVSEINLPFPWFNAFCGDIDLIGQSKPQWYHRRVFWGLSKLEMAVRRPVPQGRTELISRWGWSDELQSWTWPGSEGKTLKVRVYSTGDQVRLLLNGKEIGVKPVSDETEWKAEFDVTYAPGELKAVALSNGAQIAEIAFKTAGKPAKLRLKADRASIRRSRNDLSYVTLEVVDKDGELVPDAALPVSFSVSGSAELAAAGSANPKDVWSFRQLRPKSFHGRCLAIVRPTGAAGSATVRAQTEGLASASIVIQMS